MKLFCRFLTAVGNVTKKLSLKITRKIAKSKSQKFSFLASKLLHNSFSITEFIIIDLLKFTFLVTRIQESLLKTNPHLENVVVSLISAYSINNRTHCF